jgi:CheY-like chemotaxis protein
MASIVVMEDDQTLRLLVTSILKKNGHVCYPASDGEMGLELVRMYKPDLIVSDVQMPNMDGMTMLKTLRRDPQISGTPVILLTSLAERASMRSGMTAGADDYLTKPFLPEELKDAVISALDKVAAKQQHNQSAIQSAVKTALDSQRHSLAGIYEKRLKQELSGERWPSEKQSGDEHHAHATVIFARLLSPKLSGHVTSAEAASALKQAFTRASDAAHLFGARHVQWIEDGLLALFAEGSDTVSVNHSFRAVKAAFGVYRSAVQSARDQNGRFGEAGVGGFHAHVAIHAGAVNVVRLGDPLHGAKQQVLMVGDTVHDAIALQEHMDGSPFAVACTDEVWANVQKQVKVGRQAQAQLQPEQEQRRVIELLGIAPSDDSDSPSIDTDHGDLA